MTTSPRYYENLTGSGLTNALCLKFCFSPIQRYISSTSLHTAISKKVDGKTVHATIPKGSVGGFGITVLHRNFERMAREAMDYVSEC